MFSTTELVQAMQRRQRLVAHRVRAVGQAWAEWLASQPNLSSTSDMDTADAFAHVLAARELPPPRKASADLSRWQALRATFRQSLDPPGAHDRRERRIAWSVSVLFHLLLLVGLWWLGGVPPLPAPTPYGDNSLQVQYIGIGTPEEGGSGAPAVVEVQPIARTADAAAASAAAAMPEPAPTDPASAPMAAQTEPAPQPEAEQIASQPLQVTETTQPDTSFVLPEVTAPQPRTSQPQLQVQEIRPQQRMVEAAEAVRLPDMPAVTPRQPSTTPQLAARDVEVRQRNLEAMQPLQVPSLPSTRPRATAATPSLSAPGQQVRGREVGISESAIQAAQARSGSAAASGRDSASAGPPASSSGTRPATAAGSGQQPATAAGALPGTRLGDDWGQSARAQHGGRAGTADGLFGADGRPRLPPGTAAAGGGFPPGSDGWDRQMLDRHGTWLSRPPNDYAPTRFDQYWLPTGSLLQEWVRRGVRNMEIPIPGTSKRIRCVISVLQAGGGCGVWDPNLQDQPAEARPPPDVPWKPELQED